jgi:hypothetical protein
VQSSRLDRTRGRDVKRLLLLQLFTLLLLFSELPDGLLFSPLDLCSGE